MPNPFSNNGSSDGFRFPVLKLVKDNPSSAALISKLVDSREKRVDPLKSSYQTHQSQMYGIAQENQRRIFDSTNIMQIFPELELGAQILISSILSPKDMVNTEVVYRFKNSNLPPNVSANILKKLQLQFETEYGIKEELPRMLKDMLYTTGSYACLVLPEAAVDQLINYPQTLTMEMLQKSDAFKQTWNMEKNTPTSLGLLGNPDTDKRAALESIFSIGGAASNYRDFPSENDVSLEGLVSVTDNWSIVKMPRLLEKVRADTIAKKFRPQISELFSQESHSHQSQPQKASDTELRAALFKSAQQQVQNFLKVPERDSIMRGSIGRPLVQRIPSEAVIPVHLPEDETNPIGYFLLTDDEGHFLSTKTQSGVIAQAQSNLVMGQNTSTTASSSLTSLLIQKAKNNLATNNRVTQLDEVASFYAQIVEQDLIKRLRNGMMGVETTISKNQEVYRMMLARSMQSMLTRLVYVPKEMFTYMAFKYHDNGVGKSLLDDIKVLCSMRAILLFARVQAEAKSSIAITDVSMELDPRSPDPMKDIEMATDLISRTRQQYFPLGTNSPNDLLEWIHRAGFQLHFTGHPHLPETKFNFETKNFDRQEPNMELDEMLKKQCYMALNLQPEVMEAGFTGEFATTTITNNILLTKRIVQFQEAFSKMISTHCQKIIMSDMTVLREVADEMKNEWEQIIAAEDDKEKSDYATNPPLWKQKYLERVVKELEVTFPKPEMAAFQTQYDAFKIYETAVDESLVYWLSADMMTEEINGQISSHMDTLKNILKAHFMREWMAREGYMTELADIVTLGDDKLPKVDIYSVNKEHMEALVLNAMRYIKSLTPMRAAADKDLTNLAVDEGTGSSSSSSSDSGDSGGSDEGFGGFDDMNFDEAMPGEEDGAAGGDAVGGDEPPAEEEEPAA